MNNNELYFIPILIKAFEKEELDSSVESAINEIEKLGKKKEYKKGYEQFEKFLVAGWHSIRGGNYIIKILAGIGMYYISQSETEKEVLISKIESNMELKRGYQKIQKLFGNPISLGLELYKGAKLLSEFFLDDEEKEISHIEAGNYSIKLNNGRLLWEGKITKKEILIDKNERNNYKMAAATSESQEKPTRTIELINNEIQVLVFAGLENGKLKFVPNEKSE